MKYFVNFTEYPETIPLCSALEWIAYRKAPYAHSALEKKGKTVAITQNRARNRKTNTGLEPAMHEIYSHIKKGKIQVFGEKNKSVRLGNIKKWEEFDSWDFSFLAKFMPDGDLDSHEAYFCEWDNLKDWGDIAKYQRYFEQSIVIGEAVSEEVDFRLINWNLWLLKFNLMADLIFTPNGMYSFSSINFEDLLKLYPEPSVDYSIKVNVINGNAVYSDEEGTVGAIGRKSFDWDAFHAQVGRIISQEGLPQYQKTLVIEMQEWAKDAWGFAPSESALKEKLKLYYDLIKPKNKK